MNNRVVSVSAVFAVVWIASAVLADEPVSSDADLEFATPAQARIAAPTAAPASLTDDFEFIPRSAYMGMLQEAAEDLQEIGEAVADAPQGETGTDPRDFADKFIPYYRYMELDNGIEMHSLTMFGLIALNPRLALTYELPVAQKMDVSGLSGFPSGPQSSVPGQGQSSSFPSSGLPAPFLASDMDFEGDEVGMGDLILRLLGRPESLEWQYDDGSGNEMGKPKSFSILPTLEITTPTATEDLLGGEALIVSPALTFVVDIPGDAPFGLGFIAGMSFIDFDVYKDSGRHSTTRYRGRYFWMQPLTPPEMGALGGIYLLTEVQPIYDFMTGDFDIWIAPEIGKLVSDGFIIYAKPGWGIETDPEDRDFTFEVGMRIFY